MPTRTAIAVLLLLTSAACARPASPAEEQPVPLTGTDWQLQEYVLDGETVVVPDDVDAVLRFDGDGGYSA